MLIPLLSVSAIGLAVAFRRRSAGVGPGALGGAGLTGAWAGFVIAYVVGLVADVVLFGLVWPVAVGHIGAYVAARLAVRNRAAAGVLTA